MWTRRTPEQLYCTELLLSLPANRNQTPATAAETFLEELLELCVKDGVDDRVEGAVDVAQPGDRAHQTGWDLARQAHSSGRVDHEERRPAEQEATCTEKRDTETQSHLSSFSCSFLGGGILVKSH